MRPRTFEEPNGNITILPELINTKFTSAINFTVIACESCMLTGDKKRSDSTNKVNPIPEKEGYFLRDKIEVRDFIPFNTFVCKTPGRLPTGYGRKSRDRFFKGWTIYNDDASSLIWVENKVFKGSD